jgi:hypothetical protein
VTAIVKDVSDRSLLPERLRDFQNADYYQPDRFFAALLERKRCDPLNDSTLAAYWTYAFQPGVLETLFAPEQGTSPFVLDKAISTTRRRIFAAGQNLYRLTVVDGIKTELALFKYLARGDKPHAQFMVCDPRCHEAVETWKWVTKQEYEEDLWTSVYFFQRWLRRARKEELELEVKASRFVPVTITFVDPESDPGEPPCGKAFITPNIHQTSSTVRSCFLLYQPMNPGSFERYWEAYKVAFSRAADVAAIQVPKQYQELAEEKRRKGA